MLDNDIVHLSYVIRVWLYNVIQILSKIVINWSLLSF